MYETLLEYIKEREEFDGGWDGNVPANYKTNDVPPKALGRWINRQRTAHQKSKLKKEFVDKLNEIGLKWSVHERRSAALHTMATPLKSNVTTRATPVKSNVTAGTRTPSHSLNGNKKKSKDSVVKNEDGTSMDEKDSLKLRNCGVTSTPAVDESTSTEKDLEIRPSAVKSSEVDTPQTGTSKSDTTPASSDEEIISTKNSSVQNARPDDVASAPSASEKNGNGENKGHVPTIQTSKIECTT